MTAIDAFYGGTPCVVGIFSHTILQGVRISAPHSQCSVGLMDNYILVWFVRYCHAMMVLPRTFIPLEDRRSILRSTFTTLFLPPMILLKSTETHAEESLKGFQYSNDWTGTRLDLMDLSTAAQKDEWSMAKWPDPVLRRPASPVTCHYFSTNTLQAACHLLKQTARREGAVGLAAQQCGVDANIVFLDSLSSIQQRGGMVSSMTLINPRIVKRSPETSMQVWKEQCLVLPPSFTATLVRDAWVEVEYQTIQGNWKRKRFNGEAARCVQHEMDHDRGILITDHVSLDELENEVMRTIEIDGHKDRMALAYSRRTDDSGSDAKDSKSCE